MTWWRILTWSFLVPVGLILGAFAYALAKGYLPAILQTVAESFGVAMTVYVFENPLLPLNGSLASLLGLALGVYAFVRYGIDR